MIQRSSKNFKNLFRQKEVRQLYHVLRALCGPMRFKIVILLRQFKNGLTVSQLAKIFGVSLSRVSHQLRILRKHKLVTAQRKNREVVYMLADHRIKKYL